MVQFQIWLCVLSACAGSWAQRAGSPDYRPLEPPLRAPPPPPGADARAARNVVSSWLRMPLDHFDPHNNNTFWMQYMSNEELFGGVGSPIFIMVGGEWDIHPAWLTTGNMYEMARENHGHLFYTEHRYYGATLPFTVFTKETLQYLNVDQALADLAYFIREMKQQPRFAHSDVILYGGSYAANMALWFKQRYPHLVKGVVASSGPIKAQADFTGYLRVVNEALLSEGGQECLDIIRLGVQETVAALQTETGRREMEATYNLCVPLDYDNPFDLGYFSALITWTFSGAVQTARPGTLRLLCDNFRTDLYGVTPMQKLSGYINQNRVTCTDMRYEGYINWFKAVNDNTKAWYYQTCTEYGYYQTVGAGTVFDDLTWMNLEFYIDFCKQVYDPSFDEAFVKDAVERVNLVFGALEPEVNNTINIHGVIDPWRALGVYDSHLGETSPTITVPRASHCFDMQNWLTTDTILMTQAQQTARRLVRQWLSQ